MNYIDSLPSVFLCKCAYLFMSCFVMFKIDNY